MLQNSCRADSLEIKFMLMNVQIFPEPLLRGTAAGKWQGGESFTRTAGMATAQTGRFWENNFTYEVAISCVEATRERDTRNAKDLPAAVQL